MKSLRACICVALLFLSSASWAGRAIPSYMQVAQLKSAAGQQVVLSKSSWNLTRVLSLGLMKKNQVFPLNTNVRIRDENNRFVTYNKLPQFLGKAVAVRFDQNNRIQEMWILTDDERHSLQLGAHNW